MKPVYLLLEDFCSHRSTEIDFTKFRSALIVGKNKKDPDISNGVGKTSIIKAIEFALYGSEAAPLNVDRFVRDDTDKCNVTFDFEIKSEIYRIKRSRNRKTSKSDIRLYKKEDVEYKDISQKTSKETHVELLKLIKISRSAFLNAIVFAQSDLTGLATASPKDKKNILKEPLQLAIYSKYEKTAKEKTSAIYKNLEKNKAVLYSLGDPVSELITTKKTLIELQSFLSEQSLEKDSKFNIVSSLKNEIALLDNSYKNGFVQLESQFVSLKNNILNAANKLLSQKTQLESSKYKIVKQAEQIQSIQDTIAKAEASLEEMSKTPQRAAEIIKKDIEEAGTREARGKALIAQTELDIKKFSKAITSEDVCSSCKQVVTPEYREACESERLELLKKSSADLIDFKRKLSNVQNKKINLEKELEDLQLFKRKIISHTEKLGSKKKELETSKDFLVQLEAISSDTEKQLLSLEAEHIELLAAKEKIKSELSLKDPALIKSKLNELKSSLSSEEQFLLKAETEISSYSMQIGSITEKIKTKEENLTKITDLKTKVDELQKEYSLAQKVAQAFGPSGIPTMIINTILDDLQSTSNKLLGEIRPGMELEFKIQKDNSQGEKEDTLDVVYRINNRERDFLELSGGQKLLVALSLKLGLSQVIQNRIGIDINFLILDEVDQPLDTAAVNELVNIITKWQEKFNILVITHRESLKEKFKYAVLVENDGDNGSTGKLVTSW